MLCRRRSWVVSCRLAHGNDDDVAIMKNNERQREKSEDSLIMLGSFCMNRALQKSSDGLSRAWVNTKWEWRPVLNLCHLLDIFIWTLTAYPRAIEWLPFQWIVVDIRKKKPPPINSSVLDFWMSFLHGSKSMGGETHKKHEISIECMVMMVRGGGLIANQHVICSKQLPPLTKSQVNEKFCDLICSAIKRVVAYLETAKILKRR